MHNTTFYFTCREQFSQSKVFFDHGAIHIQNFVKCSLISSLKHFPLLLLTFIHPFNKYPYQINNQYKL